MTKIKIGVLGVSNHLIKRIILPLKQTYNCEIYGIASRSPEKADELAKKFHINKKYDSYSELLSDEEIDAVYIPLPNHLHLKWIKEAAQHGKHILCEKPLTLNAEEAKEAEEYARLNKVVLCEAFMYKYHPLWIHAQNLIKTSQLGKIMYIRTSFAYNNPNPENIRNIKEYGGGALMDIGCYAISAARFLTSKEPIRVISLMQENKTSKTDILTSGILDFDGIHSSFTVSTLSEPNQTVEIVATAGSIKIHVPFNTYVDTKSSITVSSPQGTREIEFDICDQYGLMFEAFSEKVKNNDIENNSLLDTLNNMKVIDAIFKSAKSNSWEMV
ncbi:Gfo/Idh/MocA family protein [Plebeiibacterium marinum]|uniref:Gfo/Idh/MocA family oxidoreductase n=1 Tax=Plebeiibacterium marinum TaxID=2992111 RepID=A0AAE3MF52_9BACT|nr:Gfo/Idh/MocA family oxidoreductase [Plebeiobacterium marinum]MCW3806430.1 Gfo/Idh/MocA family oxidoreductase [Plebeiobacterium marinum]